MYKKTSSTIFHHPLTAILFSVFFIQFTTACTDKNNSDTANNIDNSVPARISRGEAIDSLMLTVFPFKDSAGRLYMIDIDGKISRLNDSGIDKEAPLTDVEQEGLMSLMDSDMHIVGAIGLADNTIEAWAQVAALDGEAFANASIVFKQKNTEALGLESEIAMPFSTVSSQDIIVAFRANAFRKFEYRGAPRGGWGGVFKRALGLGGSDNEAEPEKKADVKTREKPKVYKPFDGFITLGGSTGSNGDDDGDDPRDTGPPEMYGEEIKNQVCNVKIQCRWATGVTYVAPLAQIISGRNRHCGFYTYIPGAGTGLKRLGVHIQPGSGGSTSGGTFFTGHVQALQFNSDRGFQEVSWAYNYDPYSKQGAEQCDIAKCIRKNAWVYRINDARPYAPFGHRLSNSNSFVGAIRDTCLAGKHPPPIWNNDTKFTGLHYWRRVGRDWRTNKR